MWKIRRILRWHMDFTKEDLTMEQKEEITEEILDCFGAHLYHSKRQEIYIQRMDIQEESMII